MGLTGFDSEQKRFASMQCVDVFCTLISNVESITGNNNYALVA